MRIFLTGFMGAGKTTIGRRLGERLQLPFVDLDESIEERSNLRVRDIFDRWGEAEFRRRELETLTALVERPELVVATGGGTVTVEAARRLLRASGVTVWLNPPFATIVERIGGLGKSDRPLFRSELQAWELYRARLPAYRACDVQVDIAPRESEDEVVARIELRVSETLR